MTRVLHIITGLEVGGAENMLCKLVGSMNPAQITSAVVSLGGRGRLGARIKGYGVPLFCLEMRSGRPSLSGLFKLRRIVRNFRPDVIQGWMYHGNLAASMGRLVCGRKVPVIWNIRQTVYNLGSEKAATQLVIRAGAALSKSASRIIYNSCVALQQHQDLGFCQACGQVIPNGFDCRTFRPDSKVRRRIRRFLGVSEHTVLIGLVGRYHPTKGHEDFLLAAGNLAKSEDNVKFVLAGPAVDGKNQILCSLVKENSLHDKVFLLGTRRTQYLFPALDIAVHASYATDSFSNVIGEAMACALPLIVTDVGDAAKIVGSGGLVVPPRDHQILEQRMRELVGLEKEARMRMGLTGRARIEHCFSLESVMHSYQCLYSDLAMHGSERKCVE